MRWRRSSNYCRRLRHGLFDRPVAVVRKRMHLLQPSRMIAERNGMT